MEMESCVPPGFRFHPTEEELVGYYLKRKVNLLKIDLDVIVEIDLYRMEPWDIEDRCRLGYEEQNEWYFFSHKDKKYPTGTRTNRATAAGFWKATGRDKAVLSKNRLIGMRKTLVFYKGRAPNGRKSDWIMHEYRLQTSEHAPIQEEGWVVCRAFKKPSPNQKQAFGSWNNHSYYYRNNADFGSPSCSNSIGPMSHMAYPNQGATIFPQSPFGSEQDFVPNHSHHDFENQLVEFPQLDSPTTLSTSFATKGGVGHNNGIMNKDWEDERSSTQGSQHVDWKKLDELEASFAISNFPFVSQENELNAQNHASHLFTCFPDL